MKVPKSNVSVKVNEWKFRNYTIWLNCSVGHSQEEYKSIIQNDLKIAKYYAEKGTNSIQERLEHLKAYEFYIQKAEISRKWMHEAASRENKNK